jgi:hypothetical protein
MVAEVSAKPSHIIISNREFPWLSLNEDLGESVIFQIEHNCYISII